MQGDRGEPLSLYGDGLLIGYNIPLLDYSRESYRGAFITANIPISAHHFPTIPRSLCPGAWLPVRVVKRPDGVTPPPRLGLIAPKGGSADRTG